jgi:GNAT superfamily N-acetyltransferase
VSRSVLAPPVRVSFAQASEADAAAIASVRTAAAEFLTIRYGTGHWSTTASPEAVVRSMLHATLVVGRTRGQVVAVVRLATKKPWAIDTAYFTPTMRPLYLTDMTVTPALQGQGIGRRLLNEALRVAAAWPADGIRLDAYDAPAGAGPFYVKCGFHERGRTSYRGTPLIYYERLLPAADVRRGDAR